MSAQRRGDETQTLTRIVLTVEQSAVLLDALRVGSAILAIETGRKKEEEEDDDEEEEESEEDDDSDAEGNERKPSDQDDEDDEDEEDEETWRT